MRAVGREAELDPGKMHRIYQRSVQDYHIYEDPACDYTAENPEGTNLCHLAEKIADEHLRFVSSSLLKSTSKFSKSQQKNSGNMTGHIRNGKKRRIWYDNSRM